MSSTVRRKIEEDLIAINTFHHDNIVAERVRKKFTENI